MTIAMPTPLAESTLTLPLYHTPAQAGMAL